jgi:hypothetical protein
MAMVSVHLTLAISICNMEVLKNNQNTSQGSVRHGYLPIYL